MNYRILFVLLLHEAPIFLSGQPEMIHVEGGVFLMGDSNGNTDEKPVRTVTVATFYLATTETTLGEFRKFVEETGYLTDAERGDGSYVWDSLGWHLQPGVNWRHDSRGKMQRGDQYPVLHVSWNDAAHFCNWLSRKQGRTPAFIFAADTVAIDTLANGFRLPSEAEWEYAAKKGRKTAEERQELAKYAWYSGNSMAGPSKIATRKADAAGFYDLSGNVWEWCMDWYDRNAYAKRTGARGPTSGAERCLRGGSWNNNAAHCRPANRTSRFPDFRDGSIGFRVARSE